MNGTMGVVAVARGIKTETVLGLQTLNTGVFGGILVGIIAGYAFNRFYRIKLPPYLGFFAGKRFVPIVTAFGAIALGVVLAFLWPPIGSFIENTANQVISANAPVAVFIYGLVERALLPFGLHHIWNAPFFYTINVGGWADCQGILTCFFRGHPAVRHPRWRLPDQDVRPAVGRRWRSGGRRSRRTAPASVRSCLRPL